MNSSVLGNCPYKTRQDHLKIITQVALKFNITQKPHGHLALPWIRTT